MGWKGVGRCGAFSTVFKNSVAVVEEQCSCTLPVFFYQWWLKKQAVGHVSEPGLAWASSTGSCGVRSGENVATSFVEPWGQGLCFPVLSWEVASIRC